MSRKLVLLLIFMALLLQFTVSVAFAASESESGCPPGFMPMTAEHHDDHEHHHQHVGTSVDRNGDGDICVKHIPLDREIHVHVDNNLP